MLGIIQMLIKIQLTLKPNGVNSQVNQDLLGEPVVPKLETLTKIKIALKSKLTAHERWVMIKQRFKKNSEAVKLERQVDDWAKLTSMQRTHLKSLVAYRKQLAIKNKNICFDQLCKGQIYDIKLFGKGKHSCNKCLQAKAKESRKRNNGVYFQRTLHMLKFGKCCEKCGCNDPILLDFDHINPENKLVNVSNARSTKRILEEVKKTRLLCVMCHRLHTQSQWKNRIVSKQSKYVNGIKMKIGKCTDCDRKVTEETLVCFEFDHIDPVNKLENIAWLMTKSKSLDVIEKEIAKCELRCASCHRLKTRKQFNYPKHKFIIKLFKPKVIEHCVDCNNIVVVKGSTRCETCAHLDNRKVKDRPDLNRLKLDFIELKTYIEVAKKYEVNPTSVKKWIITAQKNIKKEDWVFFNKCLQCECSISTQSVRCVKCYRMDERVVKNRPTMSQLKLDFYELKTYCAVGRKYGVTDGAIKGWIKTAEKYKLD